MAVERSQQYIDPLHLLLAVLKDTEGTGRTLLERSGVRVRELERKVKEAIGKLSFRALPTMSKSAVS